MSIFITGGEGRIGDAIASRLRAQELDVTVYDLAQKNNILNYDKLAEAMSGHDQVVHLAGIPWAMADKSVDDFFWTNVQGTQSVVKAAMEVGVQRFVYSSSTAYYGVQRGFPLDEQGDKFPLTVGSDNVIQRYFLDGVPPHDPPAVGYMVSKVMAEAVLCMYAATREIEVCILRLAPVIDKPYEWGFRLSLDNAVNAIEWALYHWMVGHYEVRNVAEPSSPLVVEDFWKEYGKWRISLE